MAIYVSKVTVIGASLVNGNIIVTRTLTLVELGSVIGQVNIQTELVIDTPRPTFDDKTEDFIGMIFTPQAIEAAQEAKREAAADAEAGRVAAFDTAIAQIQEQRDAAFTDGQLATVTVLDDEMKKLAAMRDDGKQISDAG